MSEPLYEQIAATIKARVAAGVLKPGEQLPTTREMAAEFEVGETTMKMALRRLRWDGVVVGQPGKAIYIARSISR